MKKILSILVFIFILSTINVYALDALEFYTGYLHANRKCDKAYDLVPFIFSFNFNAESSLAFVGIKNYPGKISYLLEPFVGVVVRETNSFEAGSNFLIKYTYPLTEKIKPYFKMGLGITYMGNYISEQATKYNFLPQCGIGCYYFFKEKMALSGEFHYRHLSNAGFDHPNNGVDAIGLYFGISQFF